MNYASIALKAAPWFLAVAFLSLWIYRGAELKTAEANVQIAQQKDQTDIQICRAEAAQAAAEQNAASARQLAAQEAQTNLAEDKFTAIEAGIQTGVVAADTQLRADMQTATSDPPVSVVIADYNRLLRGETK